MEYTINSQASRSLETLPVSQVTLNAEEVCVVAGVLYRSMSGDNETRRSLEKFFALFEELTGLSPTIFSNLDGDSSRILAAVARKLNAA